MAVAHQHKIGHLVPYLEIQWPGHVPPRAPGKYHPAYNCNVGSLYQIVEWQRVIIIIVIKIIIIIIISVVVVAMLDAVWQPQQGSPSFCHQLLELLPSGPVFVSLQSLMPIHLFHERPLFLSVFHVDEDRSKTHFKVRKHTIRSSSLVSYP